MVGATTTGEEHSDERVGRANDAPWIRTRERANVVSEVTVVQLKR
jgi:hypothetical protein